MEIGIILYVNGLFDIVSGTKSEPSEVSTKSDWEQNDAKAQKDIITRMEKGPIIQSHENVKEMWTKLKIMYDRKSIINSSLAEMFQCTLRKWRIYEIS